MYLRKENKKRKEERKTKRKIESDVYPLCTKSQRAWRCWQLRNIIRISWKEETLICRRDCTRKMPAVSVHLHLCWFPSGKLLSVYLEYLHFYISILEAVLLLASPQKGKYSLKILNFAKRQCFNKQISANCKLNYLIKIRTI